MLYKYNLIATQQLIEKNEKLEERVNKLEIQLKKEGLFSLGSQKAG